MTIIITGSSGMLGSALYSVLAEEPSYKIAGLDLVEGASCGALPHSFLSCDITNSSGVIKAVEKIRPDIIIHAAAFTDVDGCEKEPDKAETVNGLGTWYIAEAAERSKAALMYISTDFVFDGEKKSPYREDDIPNPINVYGRSKLEGEKSVAGIMKEKGEFFIIRSSWLFGKNGRNFVNTILKKAETEKSIKVVSDQFGSPTYTRDLAEAIANILDFYSRGRRDICGTYHITNSDDCSWYRLAEKALELANVYGVSLVPITSEELDRPAGRPAMSVLDNARYIKLSGRPLRPWYKALEDYIISGR